VPEAPITPEGRGDPVDDDGVPDFGLRGSDPAGPRGDRRPFVRFAAGLSRQHGWRLVTVRLVVFALLLGGVLFVLAEFARNV
jgi:hypothetical protein